MKNLILFLSVAIIACQSQTSNQKKPTTCNTLAIDNIKGKVKTSTGNAYYFDETGRDTMFTLHTTKQYDEIGNIIKSIEIVCSAAQCDTNHSLYIYKNGKLTQINQNGKVYALVLWVSPYSFIRAYTNSNPTSTDSVTFTLDSNYTIKKQRQVQYKDNTKTSDIDYTKLDERNNTIRYIRHNYITQDTDTATEKILKKDSHSNVTEKHYIGNSGEQISGIETIQYDYY